MKGSIKRFQVAKEYFFDEGCYITELTNYPEDPDVSIARARVEPGKTTRWHRLSGIVERYVLLEGTGIVEVGNMPPQEVSTGDVVTIPDGEHQRIRNTGKNDLIFLAVCSPRFTPDAYQDTESDNKR